MVESFEEMYCVLPSMCRVCYFIKLSEIFQNEEKFNWNIFLLTLLQETLIIMFDIYRENIEGVVADAPGILRLEYAKVCIEQYTKW